LAIADSVIEPEAQFPVRLRPETEQELATRLWRPQLDEEILRASGVVSIDWFVASWIYCN